MSPRRSLLVLAAVCSLLFVSCDVEVFVIEEGEHYSTHRFSMVTKDSLSFRTTFDDSAIYATEAPSNQGDINKLYGFSDCLGHHHTNSARFGWRWLNDELQIHAYTYVDKARQSQLMGVVGIGETHDYSLAIEGDHYVFRLDEHEIQMPRGCAGRGQPKYMLWPYFGGDETAPHEIRIYLEER